MYTSYYKSIFANFPSKVVYLDQTDKDYNVQDGKYDDALVSNIVEAICCVGRYTAKEIRDSSGQIMIKDKKLAITKDRFLIDIDKKFTVIIDGKRHKVIDAKTDSTESVVYIQARL